MEEKSQNHELYGVKVTPLKSIEPWIHYLVDHYAGLVIEELDKVGIGLLFLGYSLISTSIDLLSDQPQNPDQENI